MSVEPHLDAGDGAAPAPAPAGDRRPGRRSLAWRGGVPPVLGVAVGLLWAGLAPVVAHRSEGVEADISGEVAFAGLAVLAGVAVAVAGLVRPGARPVAGAVIALIGSVAGSLLAWGVGRLAGAPVLAATGVLVLWPLATAVTTALVTLILVLVRPDPS